MWVYQQSTGKLWDPKGVHLHTGYSGSRANGGFNNPSVEDAVNIGPIPKGIWAIGEPYNSSNIGPKAIPLNPHLHGAKGRTYFRIHGDSASNPGGASKGCIIMPPSVRDLIISNQCKFLMVIE